VTTLAGVIAAALVAVVAAPAAALLRVPEALRPEFVAALWICAAGAALTLPAAALGAVPAAYQRLDAVVKLDVAVTVVVLAAQSAVVLLGGGLRAMAALLVLGRALTLAGRWWLARRLMGPVRLTVRGYPFWSELGRFGLLKVTHQLLSQLVLYADRFLLGALVSLEAVAYYTIAVELAQKLLMVQGNVAQAYYPAACARAADAEGLRRLHGHASRAVALLTLPAAAVLAVAAAPLVAAWVGGEVAGHSAGLLRILALAYAGMALTAIPSATADALNRPELSVRYGAVGVVINIGLALLLIPPLGAAGAAWAVAGNVILQTPFFIRTVTARLVGADMAEYARRTVLEPLVPAAALAATLAAVGLGLPSLGGARWLMAAAAGTAVFVVVFRRVVPVADEERRFVAGLPGGRVVVRLMGGGG
jgi:O-antigen/teichoic acid export membrane protein